jgi:hypothetical protein
MRLQPPPLSAAEWAARIALRRDAGDWLALVVGDAGRLGEAVDEVRDELHALSLQVRYVDVPEDAATILRHAKEAPEYILLISGLESFADEQWQRLDLARSGLERSACVLLVVSHPALSRLLSAAPNLASWISGSLYRWQPDAAVLSSEETEGRLQALRAWSGKEDEDVIALARRRSLPRDPEYAEWLVLLGRSDLLPC